MIILAYTLLAVGFLSFVISLVAPEPFDIGGFMSWITLVSSFGGAVIISAIDQEDES